MVKIKNENDDEMDECEYNNSNSSTEVHRR